MAASVNDPAVPTAFVLLAHGLDADRYREAHARGEVPDESPYGFHLARERGWHLIFSTDRAEARLASLWRRTIQRLVGFDLVHAWRNRVRWRDADMVWTMTENEWLAFRAVTVLRSTRRPPVIGNSVWLFNGWEAKSRLGRWLARRLAAGPGRLTVHSDRYLPIAREALPEVAVERMYFGVMLDPADHYPPTIRGDAGDGPRRVLAMGSDWTRDWDTFLAAFGNDPRFELDLVCNWVGEDRRSHYANLLPRRPSTALSRAEMERLYAWSDVVVVPMVENRFSGITSAIDACGHGKPVISSRTGGVPTYFDEGEVLYVEPGDAAAMREMALREPEQLMAVAAAGQARFVHEDYSSRGMVDRYIALSRLVLAGE